MSTSHTCIGHRRGPMAIALLFMIVVPVVLIATAGFTQFTLAAPIALHDRGPCPDAADGACLPNRRNFGFYLPRWRPWPGDRPAEPSVEKPAVPPGLPPFKVPRPEEEDNFGRPTPSGPTAAPQPIPAPGAPAETGLPEDPAPQPPLDTEDAPPALPMHLERPQETVPPNMSLRAPRLLPGTDEPFARHLADVNRIGSDPAARELADNARYPDGPAPDAGLENTVPHPASHFRAQGLQWKAVRTDRQVSSDTLTAAASVARRSVTGVVSDNAGQTSPDRLNPLRQGQGLGGVDAAVRPASKRSSSEPSFRAASYSEPLPSPRPLQPTATEWHTTTGHGGRANPLR
jgi:hypothetical protein